MHPSCLCLCLEMSPLEAPNLRPVVCGCLIVCQCVELAPIFPALHQFVPVALADGLGRNSGPDTGPQRAVLATPGSAPHLPPRGSFTRAVRLQLLIVDVWPGRWPVDPAESQW